MTAVCGGGTSGAKVSAAAVVDYSSGLLAAIFAAYDLTWLIPVIPLVGLAPLTLSTFCGSDPPAIPSFTTAEVNAIINLTLGSDFDSGLAKLKDLILNTIWYDACECTSGSLTPLVPPSAPTGTPFPVGPVLANVACNTRTLGPLRLDVNNSFVANQIADVVHVVTLAVVKIQCATVAGSGFQTEFHFQVNHGDGFGGSTTLINPLFTQNHDTTLTYQIPIPATANAYFLTATAPTSGTSAENITSTIDLYCNGAGPGVAQPCCPPDTATQSSLDAILNLVTILQRRLAPISYIAGATHSALSGQGSFSVPGLLGMKVHLTTVPTSYGQRVGTPTEIFDVGWVSILTADGLIEQRRVTAVDTVWTPRLMTEATVFGYSFAPGVVAQVTELEAEP